MNDLVNARRAIDRLQQIRDTLARAGERYWSDQVELQRRGAAAWLLLAEHRAEEAVGEMRAAADREDATEKSAVTPGPLGLPRTGSDPRLPFDGGFGFLGLGFLLVAIAGRRRSASLAIPGRRRSASGQVVLS